ncbi:hypothetical protein [Daejeonella sp.]|uniref:hypothetical protein n=1 Tax=Daejeonella sp. TaxID=2805397 RepID=UPI0025C0A3A5|nr:hypothetical protein [Daejeonella sp.]
MKQLTLVFGLLLLIITKVDGQSLDKSNREKLIVFQDSLKEISFKMINDSIEPQRYNASYKLIKTLVTALKTPYSFNFTFDSLKTISIQNSPDQKFRVFTWHVMNNDGSYRFYGTIQMNTSQGGLEMFPLVDYSPTLKNPSDSTYTNSRWYGAQYYKIIPVLKDVESPYYMLLGWKGNTVKSTKKVIEVLHFKDGKAYFGKPVFDGDPDNLNKKRIIFEYDRRATMLLNYESAENRIIFDHLAPPDPNLKGKFELYGPDFSYDGFKFLNGRWKFISELELKNDSTDQDENFNDPKKMKGL